MYAEQAQLASETCRQVTPAPSIACPTTAPIEAPHRIAFIMPYIESQTDKVIDLLQQWTDFAPFDERVDGAVRDNCDLLFYYHRSEQVHREQHSASISAILDALPSDSAAQFDRSRVRFIYANLTDREDIYPNGANHMFYNLFFRESTYKPLVERYRYFMLLEPDVVPLRARWGTKVYNETLGDQFLMKGSQFHGRYLPAHFRTHINGNALYALGEEKFVELLKLVKKSYGMHMGYDNNIMQFLINEGNYQLWYDYVHYFVYSDFIRNMHWTVFSSKAMLRDHSNTFLVHGGNDTDSDNLVRYTNLPTNDD
eukprot:TRINITY_DN3814_c0_g1_i1.p1 TRINITY_DN3814_c0_g1~~TRINITY_DN3814_c0_g1_i1.p1  ORF type:complete len:311 (-),score=61.37 TRINITY_DN3814_c0_g1_i1:38-970(-)